MKEIVKFIKEGLKITSNTKVNERPKYNYHPKTKEELQDLLKQLTKERGNESDFNDIDTSKITDMSDLFDSIDKFNGDISNWDVSNVTNMRYMFSECELFNRPLAKWDVSNVRHNLEIFYNCPIEENHKPKFK